MNIKFKTSILSLLFMILTSFIIIPTNCYALHTGPMDNIHFDAQTTNDGEEGTIKLTTTGPGNINSETETYNMLFSVIKRFLLGISGMCLLTAVILIGWQFVKLGEDAGNPGKRAEALIGLKHQFIALAIVGSVSFVASMAMGLLK